MGGPALLRRSLDEGIGGTGRRKRCVGESAPPFLSHRVEARAGINPEIIVLTCCGFELNRAEQETSLLGRFEGVQELAAFQSGRIYATDGSHFFARPGPRIVESLEILAHLIHPELFAPPPLPEAFKTVPLHIPIARA